MTVDSVAVVVKFTSEEGRSLVERDRETLLEMQSIKILYTAICCK